MSSADTECALGAFLPSGPAEVVDVGAPASTSREDLAAWIHATWSTDRKPMSEDYALADGIRRLLGTAGSHS